MRPILTPLLLLLLAGAAAAQPVALPPGESAMVSHGDLAWLVHAPADGGAPFVVAIFRLDGEPNPTPSPSKVTGVWIIEEQSQRTAADGRIMADPVWQAAAIAKGLTVRIEDKDHADAARFPESPLPMVYLIDSAGGSTAIELPETIDGMRNLIGGLK